MKREHFLYAKGFTLRQLARLPRKFCSIAAIIIGRGMVVHPEFTLVLYVKCSAKEKKDVDALLKKLFEKRAKEPIVEKE